MWSAENQPKIVLVGHSMGGALAVHTAALNYIKNLIGLVVIDVVEGSALEALSSMQTFLQGRPKLFNSIEQAIEYKYAVLSHFDNIKTTRIIFIYKTPIKCSKWLNSKFRIGKSVHYWSARNSHQRHQRRNSN